MRAQGAILLALPFLSPTGCRHAPQEAAVGLDARLTAQEVDIASFDHALLARAIFEETNRARVEHALTSLKPLAELDAAADYQASYLAFELQVEHHNPFPGERTPAERVTHNRLRPEFVDENAEMQPVLRPAGSENRRYTYGALAERVDDRNDLLPQWLEAMLLGLVFALASLPVASAILARAAIPLPTFLLYLTALIGKNPPLPFYAAFAVALAYAAALTALSAFLSLRPERSRLGSRH